MRQGSNNNREWEREGGREREREVYIYEEYQLTYP